MKAELWNREFANGNWDFIESTSGDPIYGFIEKYSRGGSILDLGCGSGNTGCELNADTYSSYLGVDISDVALERARQRSKESHRDQKNHYCQSDISSYAPSQKYDVILFRESIYYIPRHRIKSVVDHYSNFTNPNGVIIVRCADHRPGEIVWDQLAGDYELVELFAPTATNVHIVVCRRVAVAPS